MRLFPISVFVVRENSMLPAYKPGDHVVTFNWVKINSGEPIVFEDEGKCYLKRAVNIDGANVDVAGDNRKYSSVMGPIERKQIIGRVLWRYS